VAAPAPTPPRSAWSERLVLERQLHERQVERQVVPQRVERSLSTPAAEPTASPWSTRNLGEAP